MSQARNSLLPFLLVSTVFHLLLVLNWYSRQLRPPLPESIPITVLSAPEPRAAPREAARPGSPPPKIARQIPRAASTPTRAELPPGQPAKIDRSGAEQPTQNTQQKSLENERQEPVKDQTAERPVTPDFETTKKSGATVARALPTLQDLLPPVYQATPAPEKSRVEQAPVRLDSRDPRFSAYLRRVKQALEIVWTDPSVAQSATRPYGIEAKLVVRFTPAEDGQVDEIYLTRTSGYATLDQEAIRVIVTASSRFGPPPRSFGKRPIDVTFIYEKDSVSYSFTPR
ncbi:MAG TPA: TonB family protein [Candidatus Binatia bacterium]